MNKVIELDPKYQGASAYDALAQVELSTTRMMGGKPEKAVEYLEKALELKGEHVHLFASCRGVRGGRPEAGSAKASRAFAEDEAGFRIHC
ncbi:MAG: hypothetical protein IPJ30_24015 [Acidobacteria bacterium]|nr:hypothetical protein [Acidobacteriota bacterium]